MPRVTSPKKARLCIECKGERFLDYTLPTGVRRLRCHICDGAGKITDYLYWKIKNGLFRHPKPKLGE